MAAPPPVVRKSADDPPDGHDQQHNEMSSSVTTPTIVEEGSGEVDSSGRREGVGVREWSRIPSYLHGTRGKCLSLKLILAADTNVS